MARRWFAPPPLHPSTGALSVRPDLTIDPPPFATHVPRDGTERADPPICEMLFFVIMERFDLNVYRVYRSKLLRSSVRPERGFLPPPTSGSS